MWHEARKQEKKIRGMMVDYKRRAERRRDYYERIKQDPAQFLQVHGRPAKIHLDPAVAAAADSPATMMPWQGNQHNMIDRFDVRAHLDIIPDYTSPAEPPKLCGEEDRKACYERYRTLVQNDFMGVNEDKFLHQIFLEERFGPVLKPAGEEEKKKLVDKKAAIGYVYEDSTTPEPPSGSNPVLKQMEEDEDDDEKDDLSDIDLDITVDVSELSSVQCAEMNEHSHKYGMVDDDFITYLLQDKEEADQLRLVKEIEEEKAMFSGRKSRRERRALREKKLAGRKITSPPSYAARDSPTYTPMRHSTSKSRSRSRTPPNSGKITFITSFGDEISDHDQDKKSSAHKSKDVAHKKNSKDSSRPVKSAPEVVIGPQLPERSEAEKKSRHRSSRRRSRSSSSSDASARQDRSSKRESKNYGSGSKRRSVRSRRSSSRSSSRSCSRSSNKKKKNARKHSYSRESRSRSPSSRSRSRSIPAPRKSGKSRSRSRSHSVKKSASPSLPPPPVKSYYRHSLSRSSSDLSDSDSPEHKEDSSSGVNTSLSLTTKVQQLTGKAGPTTKSKLTPQERLKRKMQLALNRQYKADKRAQMEKSEKQLQERMDRAEELREMAIKLRQRERERRHRLRGYDKDSDSDSSLARVDMNSRDEVYAYLKEHRAQSPSSDSSSSQEQSYSKYEDVKPSREYNSRGASHHSSHRSPPRDHRWGSSSSQSYKRSDSRWSPRKSPPRTSRQRSPHRYTSSSRDGRYSESRRQSSHSPYRHSSNRREHRSRSPRNQSRPRSSRPLVDY